MNSPTPSNDDSLPESGIAPEDAPPEPSSVPPLDEPPTVSAPPADEPKISLPPAEDRTASALPDAQPVFRSAPAKRAGRRGATGWALLFALASLGVAGFALWQANEWHAQAMDLRKDAMEELRQSKEARVKNEARVELEEKNLNHVLTKIGAIEGQVNKSEGHAKALETIYEQFSRSQEDRFVAEVRQAVEFADQQLRYAGNIETALIELRGAQARLEQNDHGQFMVLRQALGSDIEKLSQQSTLDMPGTALRLEQVLGKIDKLPLTYSGEISAERPSTRSGGKEQGEGAAHFVLSLAGDIWSDLRSLVKFERLGTKAEPVLLAPEQSAFLRENVKIRLLTARLAMLARDGSTYVTDLELARSWIDRFFDTRDEGVIGVINELDTLKTVPVGVIRHELIESAAAVRRFQTRGGGLAPAPLPRSTVSEPVSVKTPEVPETPASPTQH